MTYSINKFLKTQNIEPYGDVWDQLDFEFKDEYEKFVKILDDIEQHDKDEDKELAEQKSDELIELFKELHEIEIIEPKPAEKQENQAEQKQKNDEPAKQTEQKTTEISEDKQKESTTAQTQNKTDDTEQAEEPIKQEKQPPAEELKQPEEPEQKTENPLNEQNEQIQKNKADEHNVELQQIDADTNVASQQNVETEKTEQQKQEQQQEPVKQPEPEQTVQTKQAENNVPKVERNFEFEKHISTKGTANVKELRRFFGNDIVGKCLVNGNPVDFTHESYKFVTVSSDIIPKGFYKIWNVFVKKH